MAITPAPRNLTSPAKDSIFGKTFPVIAPADAHWTDTVVTQGHADYCILWGHATYRIDGVLQGRCPRCGDALPTPTCHTECANALRAGTTDCGV